MTHVQNYKYDLDHDVLHIFFPPASPSVDDEEYPGIIVKHSVEDERITGVVILDFSKRSDRELGTYLPRYDPAHIKRSIAPENKEAMM
jgi:hypothetical protein